MQSAHKTRDLEDRLQRYVWGFLPSHIEDDVEVRVSPTAETAKVLEATDSALEVAEGTLDEDTLAAIAEIDAQYVILVPNSVPAFNESNFDVSARTVKVEYLKALVLHECLHILKTAVIEQTVEIKERTEESHFDLLDAFGNIVEDGMIEQECRDNPGWSETVSNGLDLARQLTTSTVTELDEQQECTLAEAVRIVLFDELVWRRGHAQALQDPDDGRVTFATAEGQAAFAEIQDDLYDLIADIYQLRSDDPAGLYKSDRTASIRRIKRIIQFWESSLKPFFETASQDASEQRTGTGRDGDTTETPSPGSQSSSDSSADADDASREKADSPADEEDASQERVDSPGDTENAAQEEKADSPADGDGAGGGGSQALPPDELDYDSDDLTLDTSITDHSAASQVDQQRVDDADIPESASAQSGVTPDDVREALGQAQARSDSESDDSNTGDQQSQSDESRSSADSTGLESSQSSQSDQSAQGSESPQSDSSASSGASQSSQSPESSQSSQAKESDSSHSQQASDASGDAQSPDANTDEADETDSGADQHDSDTEGQSRSRRPASPSRPGGQMTFGDFGENDAESAGSQDSGGTGGDSASRDSEPSAAPSGSASSTDGQPDTSSDGDSPGGGGQSGSSDGGEDSRSGGGQSDSGGSAGVESGAGNQPSPGASSGSGDGQQVSESGAESGSQPPTNQPGGRDGRQSPTESGQNGLPEPTAGQAPSGDKRSGEQVDADERPPQVQTDTKTFEPSDFADLDSQHPGLKPPTTPPSPTPDTSTQDETPSDSTFDSDDSALPSVFSELLEESDRSLLRAEQDFRERMQSGAGDGQLDALQTPAKREFGTDASRWEDICSQSERVERILAEQLDISQRTERTTGHTAGQFDAGLAWKLSIGDTRVFSTPEQGDDKEYHLILVLDRSGSMNGENIDAATAAVATFAHAAEQLGIAVSIVDFVNNTARYVKPAVIPTELAQEALLSKQAALGTPLSDALEIAQSLINLRNEQPIVVAMTDGKPSSVADTTDIIDDIRAPVCGITLAMDESYGKLPDKAADVEDAYFRSTSVWTQDELVGDLEDFAAMLGGL